MATYSDNFNRANASTLGANWTKPAGRPDWAVSNNAASPSGNGAVAIWNGGAVGAAQASERGTGGSSAGPAVRVQADGRCLAAWLVYDYALDDGSFALNVARIAANGTPQYLRMGEEFGDGLQSNAAIRLEISEAGAFTVKVGGATLFSGSDTSLSGGTIGLYGNSGGSVDDWSGGDLTAVPQAATANWTGAGATGGASFESAYPPNPPSANWTGAGATGSASMGVSLPAAATANWPVGAEAIAGASMGVSMSVPPQDDFNRPDAALPGPPWTPISYGTTENRFRIVNNAAGGEGQARYEGASLSSSQWASVTALPYAQSVTLYLRISGTMSAPLYSCTVSQGVSVNITRHTTALYNQLNAVSFPAELKFEVRNTPAGAVLSCYVDGVLTAEVTDPSPLPNGVTGLGVMATEPEYGTPLPGADDFRTGSLPAEATANFEGAGATGGADMGLPLSATANWTGAGAVGGASMGLPTPATANWIGAGATAGVSVGTPLVSRVKENTITPEYAAWGGFDLFSGQQKGKLTSNGDRSIGGRMQLNGGDRAFFRVSHGSLLTNDGGASVAKAELRFTVKRCQSSNYRATGNAATPGWDGAPMFDVRAVTSVLDLSTGDGMEATLGGVIGSVPAAPIWKGGQLWFDGYTLGNPIREVVVDITAAYNAAIVSGDLLLALDCKLSDPEWVAELYGVEPDAPELSPRIEVHRWGEIPITIETDTCEPRVTVGALPAGATVSRIQWGYDPKLTAPGGGLKYASKATNYIVWDETDPTFAYTMEPPDKLGEGHAWRNIWGAFGTTLPTDLYLPMVQANSRVYLEIEIDYGPVKGALLFKRSWATPYAPRPNLRPPPITHYPDWLEVRGPFQAGNTRRFADAWSIWVKRVFNGWQANTAYNIGDVVISPLDNFPWCCMVAGTSGASCPLADIGDSATYQPSPEDRRLKANAYTADGATLKWIRAHDWTRPLNTPGGAYWQLWTCVDWEEPAELQGYYRWFPVLGASGCRYEFGPLGVGSGAPYPSAVPRYSAGNGDIRSGVAEGGVGLPLYDFDDISSIMGDAPGHPGFCFYSKPNGARWDVGLIEFYARVDGKENWFLASDVGCLGMRDHGTIYTVDARPDLSKFAIFRSVDWRTLHGYGLITFRQPLASETYQPLFLAMTVVAPPFSNPAGASAERVVILSRKDFDAAAGFAGNAVIHRTAVLGRATGDGKREPRDPWPRRDQHSGSYDYRFWGSIYAPERQPYPEPWAVEVDVPVTGVQELEVRHCLTADRALYTVVGVRTATGNAWLGARAQDRVQWQDGGGFVRTPGTWATLTPPTWKKSWATNPAIENPDFPDFATSSIVLQDAAGLRVLRPDTLSPQEPAAGAAPLPTPTKWSTEDTYDRTQRAVRRLPMDGRLAAMGHGGGLVVAYEGSTLKVQSVNDLGRVSGITTYTLPSPILSVYVQKFGIWEGEPNPIVTKHSDGYRTTLAVPQVDQCRLDTPLEDLRVQFSSGKLRSSRDEEAGIGSSHFVADQPNIHHRGLIHLPGHNTFALTYKWDQDLQASITDPPELMNHCGWLLTHLKGDGIQGERVRLIVTNSSAFGGQWWDLNDDPDNPNRKFCPASPDYGYNQESVGGDQYPLLMHANWYYSTDYRTWRPIPDVDYVLDGETPGGAYVLSLTLPADEVWISKEIVSDIRTYRSLLAEWKAASPNLVRATGPSGELLLPVSGGVLSQSRTF